MGSVTYRLLCLSPVLVLALPPRVVDIAERDDAVGAGNTRNARMR
jgi:hypothetical protein